MTLLFDQHLSRKLVARLADLFPQANHVALVGLERADDQVVWHFAATHGYTIVTKDSDFNDLSILRGSPPKVLWLRVGNCTTARAEQILRNNGNAIETFLATNTSRILEIV